MNADLDLLARASEGRVQLKNEFTVEVPAEQAWLMLLDVAQIIQCVPGAELLEQLDDRTFKGRVAVKLGPIALGFEGIATFDEIDQSARRVHVSARGNDKRGRGSAMANVTMQLIPQGASSKVTAVTDLQLSGMVAQYGRASGLIADISQQLVGDFARNLNCQMMEAAGPAAPATALAELASHPQAKPIRGFAFGIRVFARLLARLFRLGKWHP